MAGHHRVPSNIKPRFSHHVLIEPTIERSFIIEVEEEPYCSSISMTI